jgi:hypothetical protein
MVQYILLFYYVITVPISAHVMALSWYSISYYFTTS